MTKVLVICGPTATGKTDLGVILAQRFTGEIISADSRQVYRGMDIGTGKDIKKNSKFKNQNSRLHLPSARADGRQAKLRIKNQKYNVGYRLKEGIPVWLVDVVSPDQEFSVYDYQILARKVISDLEKRGKLPIIVGGTGLYIKALTENTLNINVPPDVVLRQKLAKMTLPDLQRKLISLDKDRFEKMNNSDRNNPRRLVRAIEIVSKTQNSNFKTQNNNSNLKSTDVLIIGLTSGKEKLFEKIDRRVEKRLEEGLIEEIKKLKENGYDWNLPSMSGLGYPQFKEYLAGKETLVEAITKWRSAEHGFAKRQLTWFKADRQINWFDISAPSFREKIGELVEKWYTD